MSLRNSRIEWMKQRIRRAKRHILHREAYKVREADGPQSDALRLKQEDDPVLVRQCRVRRWC